MNMESEGEVARAGPPDMDEPHHTIPELARKWHLSEQTLRRWFEHEEGVCRWAGTKTTKTGTVVPYVIIRIPDSVAWRVYCEHLQKKS